MSPIKWHHWGNNSIAQTTKEMQIGAFTVPKKYFNANQICQVKDKKWLEYVRSEGTQVYIQALAEHLEISTAELMITIRRTSAASNWETWVHPEIALHLVQRLGIELEFWDWLTLAREVTAIPLTKQPPQTFFEALKALAEAEYSLAKTEERLVAKQKQLEAQQLLLDDCYRDDWDYDDVEDEDEDNGYQENWDYDPIEDEDELEVA
jgi:hypothetical protein